MILGECWELPGAKNTAFVTGDSVEGKEHGKRLSQLLGRQLERDIER